MLQRESLRRWRFLHQPELRLVDVLPGLRRQRLHGDRDG